MTSVAVPNIKGKSLYDLTEDVSLTGIYVAQRFYAHLKSGGRSQSQISKCITNPHIPDRNGFNVNS